MADQEFGHFGGRRVLMAGEGSGGRRAEMVAQEREELDVEGGLDLDEVVHLAVVFPEETSIRQYFLAGDIRPIDALTLTGAVTLADSTAMENESAVQHFVHATGILVLLDAAILPYIVDNPTNKPLLQFVAYLARRISEHAGFVGGSFAEKGELLRGHIIGYTTAATIVPLVSNEHREKLKALLEKLKAEVDSILNDPPLLPV